MKTETKTSEAQAELVRLLCENAQKTLSCLSLCEQLCVEHTDKTEARLRAALKELLPEEG